MRFKKWQTHPFTATKRKRQAAARKLQNQRDALPLFADAIAADQPSVDQIMIDRAARWEDWERRDRQRRADTWRKARTALAAVPEPGRSAVRAYWQRCIWPADPVYLCEMVTMYQTDRLPEVSRPGHRLASD